MIFLKTEDEIALMREANRLVGKTLGEIAKLIKPGVTTNRLTKVAEEFIRDNGAIPTFKGYPDNDETSFPAALCTSVNEMVVHGIPNDIPLKDGDIVSVDCGTLLNGFNGDSAYTFCVGEVSEEVRQLLRVTKESLYKGNATVTLNYRLAVDFVLPVILYFRSLCRPPQHHHHLPDARDVFPFRKRKHTCAGCRGCQSTPPQGRPQDFAGIRFRSIGYGCRDTSDSTGMQPISSEQTRFRHPLPPLP